jgi:hypothetical protein
MRSDHREIIAAIPGNTSKVSVPPVGPRAVRNSNWNNFILIQISEDVPPFGLLLCEQARISRCEKNLGATPPNGAATLLQCSRS